MRTRAQELLLHYTVGIPVVVGNIRQLLCESRGSRPCGSPSLIVLMVSVDVKRHLKKTSANFASAFLSFSSTSSVQFSSTWGGFSGSGKACIIGTQSQSGKNVPNISWNLINYMYKVLIITVLNETVMAGNTSFLMSLVHTGLRATKY